MFSAQHNSPHNHAHLVVLTSSKLVPKKNLPSQRRELIELFLRLQRIDPSFFLPSHTFELLFLFLPSDVEYCGSQGPHDFKYDPRHPPRAHNIVMECRTLFSSVPQVSGQTAAATGPPPPIPQVPESWFPPHHMDARFFNHLVGLAHGSDAEFRNLFEGASVQGDRVHTAGYEIEAESEEEE